MFVPFRAMVKKEFLVQLRRGRSFWCLLILVLPMAWAVAGIWPRQEQMVWAQLPAISMGAMMSASYALLLGSALFLPGIAGATVVVEKERGCWEGLFLTLTRPSAIVISKLVGAVGLYLIFIVASLPIVGTVFFLVGVDWTQWVWSMVIIFTTAVTCGAVGIASSAHFRATTPALATSYALMTVIMGMPLLIGASILAVTSFLWGDDFILDWLGSHLFWLGFSPLYVLAGFTGNIFAFAGINFTSIMITHFVYQGAITGLALFYAWIRVRRPTEPFVEVAQTRWWRRRQKKNSKRGPGGARSKSFPPIPDSVNPMLAKEVRWNSAIRGRSRQRFFILSFLLFFGISCFLSLALAEFGGNEAQNFAVIAIFLHGLLITYFIPTRMAAVFAREHEQENFDMLRMTLLTPGEIVGGKFRAGLHIVLTLTISSVAGNLPLWGNALVYRGREEPIATLITGHISIFVCALVALTVTIWASIIAKRTATAIVTSYGFVVMALGGVLFIVVMFIGWLTRFGNNFPEEMLIILSPVSGYMYAVMDRREINVAAWLTNIVVFTVGSYSLYLPAVAFFRKFRMRDR